MSETNLTVLIADDEPLMLTLLGGYLKAESHNVISASDGRVALKEYQENFRDIDITFLDIEMPKLDGLRVLQEIRSINSKAYVVMLSGAGNLENVQTAIAAGVNGFIVKPFSNKKIDGALKNYYRSQSQ